MSPSILTESDHLLTTEPTSDRIERVAIDRKDIVRVLKQKRNGRLILKDTVCDGLQLIIGARTASWFIIYRPRGVDHEGNRHKQRRINLGNHLTLTPDEARVAANALKDEVTLGGDPREDKRKAEQEDKLERARRSTLLEQAESYIETDLGSGSRHHENEARAIRKGLAELDMEASEPSDLTLADIKRLLTIHRDRPATAKHRYGALSRFLDHLVDEETISANPATAIKRKNRPKPARPRKLKSNAATIQALWTKADKLRGVERDFLRSLILQPLRMSAMSELRPSNWDDSRTAIVLHHLETKNGDVFTLPATGAGAEIIRARLEAMSPEDRKADKRLFQLSTAEDETMKAWSAFRKRISKATGVEKFGFHDLRKVFSTELAEHDAGNADLADSALNHRQAETTSGVKGTYQQARYFEPKCRLMAEWERLVAHAVKKGQWPREAKGARGNVVPLKTRR